MILKYYAEKFHELNMNHQVGQVSPHKVCMLLAVMELIANNTIRNNRILFTETLRHRFSHYFNKYRTEADRDNPHLPFFHLKGDGFWHHQPRPGRAADYQALTRVGGPGAILKNIAYAFLDDPLFQLLQNQAAREYLTAALLQNLDSKRQRALLDQGNAWDWLECEAVATDYFSMLDHELRGESYSKTNYRRALQPKLINRTESAIEFKHQNISAILIDLGYPYIAGYKPAFNYQQQLKKIVEIRLTQSHKQLEKQVEFFVQQEICPVEEIRWENVLEQPPEKTPLDTRHQSREFSPRHYNFAEQERRNRSLGEKGEAFVINFERHRLSRNGREDLANEVEWTSREKGDGTGYDIRSFNPDNEQELFIEVKTSNCGKYQPFYISENEVAFSQLNPLQYSLYRVFNFNRHPKMFTLPGDIKNNVNLWAKMYKAIF